MTPEAWVALIIGVIGIVGSVLAVAWGLSAQLSKGLARLDTFELDAEKFETRLTKMEEVMILLARQEERIKTMDERMLAQGKRIDQQDHRVDTIAALINDRLQAINNIVAGHTAMLAQLGRRNPSS